MARTAAEPRPKPRTLRQLSAELDQLRERIEDLEDLRDLREAVRRNNGKRLIPWSEVRKQLDLD